MMMEVLGVPGSDLRRLVVIFYQSSGWALSRKCRLDEADKKWCCFDWCKNVDVDVKDQTFPHN